MWSWIIIIGAQTIAAFTAYNLGRHHGRREMISGHKLAWVLGISETCINCGCQETDRENPK